MRQPLIAIDQLLNALLCGWADETLSARIYRNRKKSWYWRALHVEVDGLFFWQAEHCRMAYLNEKNRAHMPAEYRGTP